MSIHPAWPSWEFIFSVIFFPDSNHYSILLQYSSRNIDDSNSISYHLSFNAASLFGSKTGLQQGKIIWIGYFCAVRGRMSTNYIKIASNFHVYVIIIASNSKAIVFKSVYWYWTFANYLYVHLYFSDRNMLAEIFRGTKVQFHRSNISSFLWSNRPVSEPLLLLDTLQVQYPDSVPYFL